MGREIITTLEPRQVHHLIALHNSVLYDSNDRTVQKVIKGFGMGAYQEAVAEGHQEAADDILFQARSEKIERGAIKV